MSTHSFDLYTHMIAGSVPAHAGDVEQSVAYTAADALGTSALHYFFWHGKGEPRAYYIAVPSKHLASNPDARTPLTAAIPGAPGHRGDGAYVVSQDGLSAATLLIDGSLSLITNTRDVIERHLQEIGVPIHELDGNGGGELASAQSRGRRSAEKFSAVASKASAFFIGIGVACTAALMGSTGYLTAKAEDSYLKRAQAIAKAAEDLNFVSPLSQQVHRLHNLATTALGGNGWIEKFDYTNGVTSYEVVVSQEAKDAALKRLEKGHDVIDRDDMVVITYRDGRGAPAAAAAAALPAPASPAKPVKVAATTVQKGSSK